MPRVGARFGAIGLLPEKGGRGDAIGGKPDAGDSASPQLDLTWFATPSLSLNIIAATTRHGVQLRDSALGDVRPRPCLGAAADRDGAGAPLARRGLQPLCRRRPNYSMFYGEGGGRTAPVGKVDVKNAWGWAVNSGALPARADLDPWIVGAGIRYRF